MKIICAWCDKVLKEDSEEEVSHVICPECCDREKQLFAEEQQQRFGDFSWFDFLHQHMVFSLIFGAVFLAVILSAEGLHRITGGRTPSLIEWIDKWPPNPDGDGHWRRLQRRLRDLDFRPHFRSQSGDWERGKITPLNS